MTLTSSHKADSHLSLESVCSSGYDSAQPDSRTATPTDLQAHIPEFFDDNFIPTPGHHDFPPLQLRQPDAAHKLHDKVSLSCSDSHSLCSGSTTYSLHSTATVNDTQLSTVFTPIHKCDSRDALSESRTEDHDISLNNSIASVVIHTLKHRSDGWTGPRVKSKPIDPIISRLRRGREEAIKRQEVIEVCLQSLS